MKRLPVAMKAPRWGRKRPQTPLRCAKAACALITGLATAVTARPAHADPPVDEARVAARELAQKGDAEFSSGRCARAIALWKKADAKFHAPSIVLRIARCQALTGKVVEATATLETIVADRLDPDAPAAFVDAKKQAEAELPGVRARIARLSVAVWARGTPVTPTLEIDRVIEPPGARSFPVDPGTHLIRIRAAETSWEGTLTLDEGEARALRVTLRAEETPQPARTQRLLGFIAGGIGLAALGVGGGFAYSARTTATALEGICGPERAQCPAEEQGRIDRLKDHALAADILLIGGGAFLVGGAMLVLTERAPKKEPPRVRLTPVGLGAALTGTY